MAERTWSDGLARQVLAEAVYGDLIRALPGAFTADLFGEASSPRARIAAVIEAYVKEYGSRPPESYLDTLIERDIEDRTEAEQEAVAEEWSMVRETEPAENASAIYKEVREWIEFRRMEQTLLDAGAKLGNEGVEAAQEALKTFAAVRAENEGSILRFVGDVRERMSLWATGDVFGERIPTGMSALDNAIGGGPARKENWFFLAPPKGGKTTFMLNAARGAMVKGYNVLVETFEMQNIRMMMRLDQIASKTSRAELLGDEDRVGNLSRLEQTIRGLGAIGGGEIFVKARPSHQKNAVDLVRQDMKRLADQGTKIDMVIFDYLNIMGSTTKERELRIELMKIAYEMADLAKEQDVVVWSAALVNRQAVDKVPIRKNDIAEAFGVIGAVDGAVAICSPPILVQNNIRRLYVAAAREERDEVLAGDYRTDWTRATIARANQAEVDALLASVQRKRAKFEENP